MQRHILKQRREPNVQLQFEANGELNGEQSAESNPEQLKPIVSEAPVESTRTLGAEAERRLADYCVCQSQVSLALSPGDICNLAQVSSLVRVLRLNLEYPNVKHVVYTLYMKD